MAATHIYGKNPSKIFYSGSGFHKTWYVASGIQPIIVCSNDDLGIYFNANFVTWEKLKTVDFFQKLL